MTITRAASVSAAIVLAITLFDASSAQSPYIHRARTVHRAPVRKVAPSHSQRSTHSQQSTRTQNSTYTQRSTHSQQSTRTQNSTYTQHSTHSQHHARPSKHTTSGTASTGRPSKTSNVHSDTSSRTNMSSRIIGTGKTGTAPGIGGLQGKLPQYKTVANTSRLRGRVGVPVNLQPKYTVAKPPYGATKPRLTPFVQRYWRRTFFWVAVAGLGYVTVPEDYYDRFVTFINGDDPDYEAAIALLSLAASR